MYMTFTRSMNRTWKEKVEINRVIASIRKDCLFPLGVVRLAHGNARRLMSCPMRVLTFGVTIISDQTVGTPHPRGRGATRSTGRDGDRRALTCRRRGARGWSSLPMVTMCTTTTTSTAANGRRGWRNRRCRRRHELWGGCCTHHPCEVAALCNRTTTVS